MQTLQGKSGTFCRYFKRDTDLKLIQKKKKPAKEAVA
jgi:hypothetical protein